MESPSSEEDNDIVEPEDPFDPDSLLGPAIQVGQSFKTGSEAYKAVQDYALSNGKSVCLARCSGMERKIVCTSPGCSFIVRVYRERRKDKTYGNWCIASLELEGRNCISTARPTTRQIAALPTFVSAVRASRSVSASALVSQLQERDGLALGKHKRSVYRAREAVNAQNAASVAASIGKLPSYLQMFASENPGCVAFAEKDNESRFCRAIVIVKVFTDAIAARQSLLGVDCSHSKCAHYLGVQMHLVGRDGNLKNVTIAFALVPAEACESYAWFFGGVMKAGCPLRGVPRFSVTAMRR